MDLSLESLSKEELIALINKEKQSYSEERIAELEDENAYLKSQLAMYKRMQFGQKRERFEGDPAQIELPFQAPAEQITTQEEILKEKINYVRSRPNHKGRAALPSHLPVEEIEIYPAGDLSEMESTLPKSQIGKAMQYSYARWDALSAYLYDGNLLIDNNQIENAIRPLALGRKNYRPAARLFAGTHDAAQRAAMIYSFFAICKKHSVNPFHWLKHTLQNICTVNHKHIKSLYPQNFNKIPESINM
uniref:IS66 family transposase n=1 Tax=Dyadobacter sp. OTU695 TaxID=3043860 RepID=UPI00313E33BF